MQKFINYINEFKNNYSVYWDFLLLLIGSFLPYLCSKIIRAYKINKIRIKLRDIGGIEDLNILRICSATPTYQYGDIHTNITDFKLFVSFPENLRDEVLKLDPDFHFHCDHSFNKSGGFEDLILKTQIPNLKELIDKHRFIVAHWFINQQYGCKFNRLKYGIYKIQYDKRKGNNEIPEVKIDFFETDYFTHRVFRSIYAELKQKNHPISMVTQDQLRDHLNQYNCFTTSLGINAFVVADSRYGESIIFSKRSADVAHSENAFKYNSTVMEGISRTDYDDFENGVSLQQAIERALYEELGLSRDHLLRLNARINYCDFFLEKTILKSE